MKKLQGGKGGKGVSLYGECVAGIANAYAVWCGGDTWQAMNFYGLVMRRELIKPGRAIT